MARATWAGSGVTVDRHVSPENDLQHVVGTGSRHGIGYAQELRERRADALNSRDTTP